MKAETGLKGPGESEAVLLKVARSKTMEAVSGHRPVVRKCQHAVRTLRSEACFPHSSRGSETVPDWNSPFVPAGMRRTLMERVRSPDIKGRDEDNRATREASVPWEKHTGH